MPIGAAIGSAVVGGGAAIIGANKNAKSIDKATQAQQDSTNQQVALQRDIYGQNRNALAPFMARGNAAGDTINALLGLGGSPQGALSQFAPTQQPNALAGFGGPNAQPMAYGGSNGMMDEGALRSYYDSAFPGAVADYGNMRNDNINWNALMGAYGPPQAQPVQPQPMAMPGQTGAAPPGQTPQQAAMSAYDIFKNSSGYQNRYNEALRGVNSNYAGRGVLQSGAAMKAIAREADNLASNEFGNYLGYLGNQQGVGFSGASALAGVGQSYANNMGQVNQNQANALASAAGLKAQNSNALLGGLAGVAGNTFGVLSSYGQPKFPPAAMVSPNSYYGNGTNMNGAIWNPGW